MRALRRRGCVRWIVDRFEEGLRKRSIYPSKREADAEASRLRQQAEQVGSAWLSLPPNERDDLLKFRQACIDRGLPLWDLLRAYDNREVHVATASPTLRQAVDELVTAKEGAGRSSRYTAIRRLREMLHWEKWPKDVTRHTAASYSEDPLDRRSEVEVAAWDFVDEPRSEIRTRSSSSSIPESPISASTACV